MIWLILSIYIQPSIFKTLHISYLGHPVSSQHRQDSSQGLPDPQLQLSATTPRSLIRHEVFCSFEPMAGFADSGERRCKASPFICRTIGVYLSPVLQTTLPEAQCRETFLRLCPHAKTVSWIPHNLDGTIPLYTTEVGSSFLFQKTPVKFAL